MRSAPRFKRSLATRSASTSLAPPRPHLAGVGTEALVTAIALEEPAAALGSRTPGAVDEARELFGEALPECRTERYGAVAKGERIFLRCPQVERDAGQSFIYNAMLQLTSVSGGGRDIQYNYSANQNNGKIVSETDLVSGEQVNYTYDALNRLATAMTSDNPNVAQWGQSFTYDGFGNLTNVNVIKGSAPIYSANPDPATNHVGCTDANGNTSSASQCGLGAVYDVENRLVAWTNQAWGYAYAPGNKRVWRGAGTYDSSTGTWSTDELTFWAPNGQKLGTYQVTAVLGCQFASPQCGNAAMAPEF